MSDTPRTDAMLITGGHAFTFQPRKGVPDMVEFARQLERELAAAQANAEHWKVMYECAQNANAYRQAAIDAAIKEKP